MLLGAGKSFVAVAVKDIPNTAEDRLIKILGYGAPPSQRDNVYSTALAQGYFVCDGGRTFLPLDRLNDSICDCHDTTDEPGTSACPEGRFYCAPERIYVDSSTVNDGVCDCCRNRADRSAAAGTRAGCQGSCMDEDDSGQALSLPLLAQRSLSPSEIREIKHKILARKVRKRNILEDILAVVVSCSVAVCILAYWIQRKEKKKYHQPKRRYPLGMMASSMGKNLGQPYPHTIRSKHYGVPVGHAVTTSTNMNHHETYPSGSDPSPTQEANSMSMQGRFDMHNMVLTNPMHSAQPSIRNRRG